MIVRNEDSIRILTFETEHLDALNSDETKKLMIENIKNAEKIILNLEKIIFIDSSGLGAILAVFRSVKENSGNMVICSVRESVKILFKLVRLSHMIKIFDTEKEAKFQV